MWLGPQVPVLAVLKLYHTTVAAPGGTGGTSPPPTNPENLQRMGNSPRLSPAMRIDRRKIFKFLLNFSEFLLKFSYKLSKFSDKLLKFSIKFSKFVQTLTNFSQITIINLIYNTVNLNCYKLLQTLINFIKFVQNCFKYLLKFVNNILIFKQISNFNNFSKHSYISYLFKMFHMFAKQFEIF